MSPARAWLALLRPPNFLTVPGDVLAGFFLAAGLGQKLTPELLPVVAAAILFYGAGLLLNDWADVAVDRAERPDRPLPAGLVSRRAVFVAAVTCLVAGIALCSLQGKTVAMVGLSLAAAICVYNFAAKNLPLVGPLTMGGCRGLNLLLGAVLVAGTALPALGWWGVATLVCYITAVTHLARREMVGRYGAFERWLPALVLAASFLIYLPLSELVEWPGQVGVAILFLLGTGSAARIAQVLPNRQGIPADPHRGAVPVPRLIGRLISLLLFVQAAFILGSGDGWLPFLVAAVLCALWPLKIFAGRIFYSS